MFSDGSKRRKPICFCSAHGEGRVGLEEKRKACCGRKGGRSGGFFLECTKKKPTVSTNNHQQKLFFYLLGEGGVDVSIHGLRFFVNLVIDIKLIDDFARPVDRV